MSKENQTSDNQQGHAPLAGVGSSNLESTVGVGVYCKCGKIIYACTDDCYSMRNGKKEVDWYFNKGYKVGRITRTMVQELFGCNCVG